MPLTNPFRRSADRPSFRERAASLSGSVGKPEAAPASAPEAEGGSTLEDFAGLDFTAYTLDGPVKTPTEWANQFIQPAMAMHIADRTLRMTKPELITFIRKAGERDAAAPEIMFRGLDTSQETLEGWGNLLGTARARYIVAASAACLEIPQTVQADETGEGEPKIEPETPSFAEQVARAGHAGDVLAVSGIDHCDGTVSYADARGTVVRRPLSHWIAFNAQQMYGRVRNEINRRRAIEANHLPLGEHVAWEAEVRCELRIDAVHDLAFRHVRAFEAAQAFDSGAEPATQAQREQSDRELLALAPVWDAAADLYQQRIDEEEAVCEAAGTAGWPGAAPAGSGPEWQAWFAQKEAWRERTGIAAAEDATGEAGTALHQVEVQIGELSAASLAGLKFKARVAQRSDDIGVDWPDNLGAGLARDILAMTEARIAQPEPSKFSLVGQIDVRSATMRDLRSLHDVAHEVGSVAYAMASSGRGEGRREARGLGHEFNVVGKLMQRLGDELGHVGHVAVCEARQRTPRNDGDRDTRLEILALPIIQNDDPAETAAFARELLASVEK